MAGCCRLLGAGILCSCSCPCRPVHHVPVNLQQDKCHSLFCNYLSLCEWKSVIPLKVRALSMGYHVYFRLEATFFYKRCRASMTKHRQQSTRLRAKGIDAMWSQVCSSLLHLYFSINKETCFSFLFSDVCVCVSLYTYIHLYYIYKHICHIVFRHSLVDSHLVCYQIFAFINISLSPCTQV